MKVLGILFLLILFLFFLLLPSLSANFSVGVSPPIIELWNLKRGESKIVKFYLVSPTNEPLLVKLEAENGNLDFFDNPRYKNLVDKYSEESVKEWVEFFDNPVEIKPANKSLKTVGGEITGWKEVSFVLKIPEDAEPGYHLVRIKPIPYLPSETFGQVGTRVVAITLVNVIFNVSGNAVRDGVILDTTRDKISGNSVGINTYFKNIGTVTMRVRAINEIYENGKKVETITSPIQVAKPSQTIILKSFLPLEKISSQKILVKSSVDFSTGKVYKNSTISLEKIEEIKKPIEIDYTKLIFVGIVILIVFIAILYYRW